VKADNADVGDSAKVTARVIVSGLTMVGAIVTDRDFAMVAGKAKRQSAESPTLRARSDFRSLRQSAGEDRLRPTSGRSRLLKVGGTGLFADTLADPDD
jgi:hypothetical protein